MISGKVILIVSFLVSLVLMGYSILRHARR